MSKFDQETHNELLVAIQHYLSQSPCREAAEVLKNEIEKNQLLPVRYDYTGQIHRRTFEEYEKLISCSNVSLVSLVERLSSLISLAVPIPIRNLPIRIFTNKRHALDRKPGDLIRKPTVRNTVAFANVTALKKLGPVRALFARQLGRPVTTKQLLHKSSMNNLELHYRILGHLSSVFCVVFDKSGSYIITGADDNLIKVWNVRTGLLRFTLRGHSAEISDITVSEDNILLASGSVDKTVRIWCLQTAEPLTFYRIHSAMVTLVAFLPFVDGTMRYLVSAGGDCLINFYRYNSENHEFEPTPTQFYERTSSGARIVSSCHSPSGSFIVFGDTHHNLRVYRITSDNVVKISDIDAHSDRVDSLAWAHVGLRFASGSRDGIAKIWKFEFNDWSPTVLHPKVKDEKASNSRNSYKVTMICWSSNDDFVVTAGSDSVLRVWSSTSGEELRQLVGHKEDVYVLHSHPVFEDYVLAGGHDGYLMVWDVYEGVLVKRHQNFIEGSGYGAIFDFAISPDGTLVAAVDSHGHLSVLGIGTNQMAKTTPKEQFFHTDYMPLILDENNYFVDEETEVAPHLMGPPRMVDADGSDYDDDIQALVPGRDLVIRDDSLIPQNPPWLSRQMVCTLPQSVVKNRNTFLTELRQQEEDIYNREQNRIRPNGSSVTERKSTTKKTVSRRRRAAVCWSECFPHRPRSLRNQLPFDDPENDDDDVDGNSLADSSFSCASVTDDDLSSDDTTTNSDSSDTDYVINTRRSTHHRRRRNGSSVRDITAQGTSGLGSPISHSTRRRRRIVVSDDADDEPLNSENVTHCEPGPSNIHIDYDDTEPGPSNRNSVSSRIAALRSSADSTSGISTPEQNTSTFLDNYDSNLDFPRWMRLTQPLRFPYVAQIGDEVVYFRQGHEFYLEAVETRRLYQVTHRLRPLAQLNAEEFCIVEEIKYLRKPYRLTAVKLAQTNAAGIRTGLVFSVKFHDMESVPDFIILRHLYDESVARRYQPGTRIETILDNHWWTGTIDKKEVHDEENYPRSNWYCLTVRWDTGEDEKMSPWDVQPQQPHRRSGIASEEDQVLFSQYPVNERDWIGAVKGITACSERLIDAVRSLESDPDIKPFTAPVSLVEYPDYLWDVDYPTDLSTIVERVKNRFYRRLRSLEQDIRYIAINARLFNQPNSEIVRNSRVLVETLIRYLNDIQHTNAVDLYHILKAGPDSELKEYNLKQSARFTTEETKREAATATPATMQNGRRRQRIAMSPNSSVDLSTDWYTECVDVLQEVMSERTSTHFIGNDNQIEWLTDVFSVYDNLSTVREKVLVRKYSNPLEVVSAVKTLMQVCRNVVDNKRSPVFRDSLACGASFDSKMAPVVAKWQRMRQSESILSAVTNVEEGHQLRARPRNSHVYNTRSRRKAKQNGNKQTTKAPLRSGRSGRMPSGYYRDLNNGTYADEGQGTSVSVATGGNNQSSARTRRNAAHHTYARNHRNRENGYSEADQPGPSGLQNRKQETNLRRSLRRRENRSENKDLASEGESSLDTIKKNGGLFDGSTTESDDDPVSDCSWDIRTNGTKRSKNHRKRTNGNQGNEMSRRQRQAESKVCGSDLSSASASFSEQDSKNTRTYATRNRDRPRTSNHSTGPVVSTSANNSQRRIRLRRSAQRNVSYNEIEFSDDDEASSSTARPIKKRRKIEK